MAPIFYPDSDNGALRKNLGRVYRARRRNHLGGLRISPKLLRRSCKSVQNAHPNENKGGAAAEGRHPPFFSMLMVFWALLHERCNNLWGGP